MNITSTRFKHPLASPAVQRALDEGTQTEPALLSLSPGGATSFAAGAAAYRNKGYRTLTKATTKLASAMLKAAYPNGTPVIDGIALAIGAAADVSGFLEDGSISPGEVLDMSHLVARGAVAISDRGPVPPGNGPDDGFRGDPAFLPEWLTAGEASIGMIARVGNDVFSAPVSPSPFALDAQSRDRLLADMAKALRPASPIVSAALQVMDVLSDPFFWEALNSPDERPLPKWAEARAPMSQISAGDHDDLDP